MEVDDNTMTNARIVDVDAKPDDVDFVINDGEWGRREGGDDTTDDGTNILVKCGCPTVDGWAEAELERRTVSDSPWMQRGSGRGRGAELGGKGLS